MKCDLEEKATVVQDIGDPRSKRAQWLHDLTGFLHHLTTLKDEEIVLTSHVDSDLACWLHELLLFLDSFGFRISIS